EATAAGVSSESRLVFGKPGLALIKEVLKVSPQLLLAGDAEKGQVAEALFGSTTIKLLKQCPCPLWITNVEEGEKISSVLVAHCLTEIGSAALRWGAAT